MISSKLTEALSLVKDRRELLKLTDFGSLSSQTNNFEGGFTSNVGEENR